MFPWPDNYEYVRTISLNPYEVLSILSESLSTASYVDVP